MSKPRQAPKCMVKKTGIMVLLLLGTFVKAGKCRSLNAYTRLEPGRLLVHHHCHFLWKMLNIFSKLEVVIPCLFPSPQDYKRSKASGRVTRKHCKSEEAHSLQEEEMRDGYSYGQGSLSWLYLLAAAQFLSGKLMFVSIASKYNQFSPSSPEAMSCCWSKATQRQMSQKERGREAETAYTHKMRNTELEELQKRQNPYARWKVLPSAEPGKSFPPK